MIYVIEEDGGRINGTNVKIGHSAENATRRRGELQTGNPRELTIIAILKGGPDREAELHHRLRRHRVRGEWFCLTDAKIRWLLDLSAIDYPILDPEQAPDQALL